MFVLRYLFLVLFPQVLWFLSGSSNHGGTPLSLCENCSPFQTGSPLNSAGAVAMGSSECVQTSGIDNLTARLCSCQVSSDMVSSGYSDEEELVIKDDGLGGWHMAHCLSDLSGPCTIQRRDSTLTPQQFLKEFAFNEPVILTGISDQEVFRAHSTKYRLLKDFGHELITVATANTHSYRKVQMTLCDYVKQVMKPQTYQGLGNETLYLFGDNDRKRWDSLFSLYQLPPYPLPSKEPVLSFGLAGPGTGVPFHLHGATFAETIYGRKRWFLYHPSLSPPFDPDETTLKWLNHTYPSLSEAEKPLECTLNPGEIIFLPNRWWHSTLNLDSVVFMSTFYS